MTKLQRVALYSPIAIAILVGMFGLALVVRDRPSPKASEVWPTGKRVSNDGGQLTGGGLNQVTHDGTLTGTGRPSAPLGTVGGGLLSGVIQPSTATGTQNDFTINATTTVLRWNGASDVTFTGFTGGADGRILLVENATGVTIVFSAESGSSAAANRLWLSGPSNQIVLISPAGNPNSFATFVYDGTSSRWRMQSYNSQRVDVGMEWVQASQFDGTLGVTGAVQINNTVTTNSWITAGTSLYAGGNSASIFISALGAKKTLGCAYTTNATARCYDNGVGYSEGQTQFRDKEIDDGKGAEIFTTLGPTHHIEVSGTAITTGDLSACGTTPAISTGSTDTAGTITEGTTATGCTLTFKGTYTNNPFCTCEGETSTPAAVNVGCHTTATTLVIENASASNDKITYICLGRNGGT